MAFAIGIEVSINVDMGIDPSRHDGQSFQIVGRALGVGVDPGDERSLDDDTHIAHDPTFAVEQRRRPDNRGPLLRSGRFRQYQAGNQKNPQS